MRRDPLSPFLLAGLLLACSPEAPPHPPSPSLLGEATVHRGALSLALEEERLPRRQGIEQRWHVPSRPEGAGPLEVHVPFEGARSIEPDATGLSIRTDRAAFHYGHGTWIEANGRRHHVPVRAGPSGARLVVPESVLGATRYPAILDPILRPVHEVGLPRSWTEERALPVALAWDPDRGRWLYVHHLPYADALRLRELHDTGAPVEERDWLVDEDIVELGLAPDTGLAVRRGEVLVVWQRQAQVAVRRWADGAWLDPSPRGVLSGLFHGGLVATPDGYLLAVVSRGVELLELSPDAELRSRRRVDDGELPDLACGPRACLLAYTRGSELRVLRVDWTGRPLDPSPTTLAGDATDPSAAVAADGDVFMVVSTERERTRAFRLSDGGGASPPLLLSASGEPAEVVGGPGMFLVLQGTATRIRRDGLVSSSAPLGLRHRVPWKRASAGWNGSRWLVAREPTRSVLSLRTDGTVEHENDTASAPAELFSRHFACTARRCLATWLEFSVGGPGPFRARAAWIDASGRPGSPFWLRDSMHVLAATDEHVVVLYPALGSVDVLVDGSASTVSLPPGFTPDEVRCGGGSCMLFGVGSRAHLDLDRSALTTPVAFAPSRPHRLVSGAAGHLLIESGVATVIEHDGSSRSLALPPMGPAFAGDGVSNGWLLLSSESPTERRALVLAPDGTVISAHPLADPGRTRQLTCAGGGCWLLGDGLTALDEGGRTISGPSPTTFGIGDDVGLVEIGVLDAEHAVAILQTDPDIVRRRLLALPLEVGRAQGEPCFTGAECASAFCVDGACCESACEGGCEACSAAWGGVEDGRCTPVSAGWTCRTAREGCDLEERCDGTSTACPPDARIPPGEICRPSAGPCDVPERCGSSTWCPEDGFDDSGAVCRRAVSACDADEVCDGLMAECPADWVEAPGTVCRPASGACDVDDVCDGLALHCGFDARAADGAACGDGDACNGEEVCARGVCAEGRPLRCDDGDRCTADACDAALGCTHTPVEPCCGTHRDCDDGDACTVDRCGDGDCAHRRVEGCCTVDADCGVGSRCRDTRCAPAHDAGAVDPGARPPTAGCGCRATVRGGGGLAWLLLLGLALLRRQKP
ncbi:MAG: hypothetical protein RID93_12835 [Sandaracinaceae bacterium]